MRLPKQVLIIPYRIKDENVQFCIFKRKDLEFWQWISGGVEDFDENIYAAAKREIFEETGVDSNLELIQLECITKIPVVNIVKEFRWGNDIFYADEYSFSVKFDNIDIALSDEHSLYSWMSFEEAKKLLKYDSNKSALWELNEKIKRGIIK